MILNLYELNILLSLLEEKVNKNEHGMEDRVLRVIYKKLENYVYDMNFNQNDDIEKILEEQKNYESDERG